jgi:ATP-dependent helicase/nuclease subunit A
VKADRQDWSEAILRAERVAQQARAAARPTFHRPTGLREDEEAKEERTGDGETVARYLTTGAAVARAVGIAVHEVLERWNFREPDEARAFAAGAGQRAARATGADAVSVVAATREVLDAFLGTDLPAYLASLDVVGREVPFLLDDKGVRWSGTIDLIYRQPDGALVVADYKTDREIPDQVPESYRDQLSVYSRAVGRAFPDQAKPLCELLYVRGGERVRLLE